MSTISILRYVNGELASADTTTLAIENTNGVVIAGPSIVVPVSAGTYVYDVTALAPGNYTANWIFTVAGEPTATVARAFVIDAPMSTTSGVTLMEIEQGLAGRLGGSYRRFVSGNNSTILAVHSTRLKSSVNGGDFEDLYVLRRGIHQDGSRINSFPAEDRVRMVSEYEHMTGLLSVDQDYTMAAVPGELIELHYFEPEYELRPSVVEGLQRCYFWDTVRIASTAPYGSINLSSVVPWISDPRQVFGAEGQTGSSYWPAQRIPWFRAYRRGPSVMLDSENTMPGHLILTMLRPASSLINDAASLAPPNDDFDVLPVEKEYAIRAAHVAAWVRHPERLTPIAAQGMGIPLSMAAQAFSTRSLAVANFQPEFPQVRWGPGYGDLIIGNLPEPAV